MPNRSSILAGSALLLGLVVGGCATDDALDEDELGVSTSADALSIATSLSLDRTTVGRGETQQGTVTYRNSGASSVRIRNIVIAERPPGGTNAQGPYLDMEPRQGLVTIAPGATITVRAARTFAASDPTGSWYAYATYQDDSGAWHDGPSTSFAVTATPVQPPPPATGSTPQWPFERPALSVLRASRKKVFAHWHWYPTSFDNGAGNRDYYATQFIPPSGENGKHLAYGGSLRERPLPRLPRPESDWEIRDGQADVKLAKEIGIDGFFLNMWNDSGSLWNRWMAIFDGATRETGFGVIPNFDLAIMGGMADAELSNVIVDIMSRVKNKPSLYRASDGRVVMGVFYAERKSVTFYGNLIARLQREQGLDVQFVPVLLGTGNDSLFSSMSSVSKLLAGWGTAVPQSNSAQQLSTNAKRYGASWMHPILAQDYRPYTASYWEAKNTLTARSGWENVIASDVDFVQLVTWNDQGEHHAVRPATGKQWSAYDLTAYYITWFKTGARPPIVRDALYYSHRIHAVGAVPSQQSALARCNAGCPGTDEIELLSFLTAPGTIQIDVGGAITQVSAPAGMTSLRAPLRTGRPRFRLVRGGSTTIDLQSAFDVRSSITRQDLLYRGGGSLRAAMNSRQNCASLCQAGNVVGCETCPSEPMWLVANP